MPPLFPAVLPAVPLGPLPFTRKAWDNPFKYKLNRQYGDEFEEMSFRDVQRRWKVRNTTASEFYFPGGSRIEWQPNTTSAQLYQPVPQGDFEAVLEMTYPLAGTYGPMFGIAVLDVNGTGYVFTLYTGDTAYLWHVTAWVYDSGPAGSVAGLGASTQGGHIWLNAKIVGTAMSGRVSLDGSTWSAAVSGATVTNAAYLAIGRFHTPQASWANMHRFNVYPGPTFFPG